MLTAAELNALPYTGAGAINKGLTAAAYERQYADQGEALRWWKAVPVPVGTPGRRGDGRLLIEQVLPTTARVMPSNVEETVENEEFGLIQKGALQVASLPHIARFNHLDVIALLGQGRVLGAYAAVTRSASGNEDELPHGLVKSIAAVWIAGVLQSAADYQASENGIVWLDNAPTAGGEYSVEYEYYPRYLCLPQRIKTAPEGRDGKALPLYYWLQREMDG
jgi:hypothetical protein